MKNIAAEIKHAPSTQHINDFKMELNGDVDKKARTIKQAMEDINDKISNSVDNIQEAYNSLTTDCVASCNKEDGTCKFFFYVLIFHF